MDFKHIFPLLAFAATTTFAQSTLSSGIDLQNMNMKVKPGSDFYEYAVGGWNKANPLTAEYARYTQFEKLGEQNQKQLRELIEGLAREQHPQSTLQHKIGAFYRLAMDSVRRNREGYEPIKPTLKKVNAVKTRRQFTYLAAELSARGISSFFNFSCGADLKDSKNNLMMVGQGGLSMGNRDYYVNDDEPTKKIREAYREYIKQLYLLTGATEAVAAEAVEAVMKVETRIAKVSYTSVQRRDVENNYHKMSYATLLEDYPGIDWSTLFLMNGIPPFEHITVNQPEPIHEVEKILAEEPLGTLKHYLYFKVVNDAANSLSDGFREASFNFFSRTMSGAQQDRPRWKRAVGAVEGALGMAVGKMYVEKYFPESSKKRMVQLVKNLQQALGERIDLQDWMSDATKQKAHEKLATFYVKIGYPDKWQDFDGLSIDENLSYYENCVRASQFASKQYIDSHVNKPVDRTEWLMTPQTINAYYNPTTNEICFPAGILQPPFFNAEADDACNYGAIGVVIGHEMTHGFDDKGSLFDKDGNLANWWTEEDKQKFKERTQVMKEFFDKIEVLPGLHANGALTLGENIADHGGLNIAYTALQNAMKEHPLGKKDGLTPEQRFYVSYATLWAGNMREELVRQYTLTDPHSNIRWRVNGALPHIDEWYKAFNITKKSPLFVPQKKRVRVW